MYFLFQMNFFVVVFLGSHWRHMGGSQARGWIAAVAAGLHHSHSNARSELCLWPTPQLWATPDRWPTEWGQGSDLYPCGILVRFVSTVPCRELPLRFLYCKISFISFVKLIWSSTLLHCFIILANLFLFEISLSVFLQCIHLSISNPRLSKNTSEERSVWG